MKWEGANPTGSLKDRMALAMVQEAKKEGSLKSEEPIVEFTGGSTGSSLAMVCAVLDHPLTIGMYLPRGRNSGHCLSS